jgi:hypothetical protein
MDIPLFIFGIVLFCFGIYQIGKGISWFKKVFKYTDGLQSWSALAGSISIMIGIVAILESFQFQVIAEITTKSKISPMNVPRFLLGLGIICTGIWTVIFQIKWYKKGLKDPFGNEVRLLIGGFGFIVLGIILIVKSF